MARMKTGRLTTKTTPPEKYIVTSKRETVKPRELTSREAKYNADDAAYSKYQSDSTQYVKDKAKFDKGNFAEQNRTERKYADFGGKQNMRTLNPGELAKFNSYTKANNENLPEQTKIEIQKSNKSFNPGEGDSFNPSKVGAWQAWYKEPTAPKKVTPPNSNDIPLDKLPLNKITSIKTKGSAPKARKEVVTEKADFVNPRRNIKDVKVKTGAALTSGKGGLVKDRVGEGGLKAARAVKGEKNIYDLGYKKEEKRFKAYAGTTATGDSFVDMTPSEIRDYRSQAKSARAEYRKQPDSDLKSMGKAAMTSEIRQSRKAEKFADQKLNLNGRKSVKHFTDKNYGGNIEKDYRESSQNAANRNTMDAKIKAIGKKSVSRTGSFGNMPTS